MLLMSVGVAFFMKMALNIAMCQFGQKHCLLLNPQFNSVDHGMQMQCMDDGPTL
jgi:hypothetical protein